MSLQDKIRGVAFNAIYAISAFYANSANNAFNANSAINALNAISAINALQSGAVVVVVGQDRAADVQSPRSKVQSLGTGEFGAGRGCSLTWVVRVT